jgi:hypothetical protein
MWPDIVIRRTIGSRHLPAAIGFTISIMSSQERFSAACTTRIAWGR